jgi:hypothetical protein
MENEMLDARGSEDVLQVPSYITKRYDSWRRLWRLGIRWHYILGILSVSSSAIAAVVGGNHPTSGQAFAAFAAILTAAIGFIQPKRIYTKFVKAWRMLDIAILKFQAGRADLQDLLDAVEAGEALITEYGDFSEEPSKSHK